MKRVTAATTPEGRSYVESIEELPSGRSLTVFEDTVSLDGVTPPAEPDPKVAFLQPPDGGAVWRFAILPPRGQDPPDAPAVRGKLHNTHTVDFTYLAEGELELELDEERVDLQAGDFVVLKAANHAWHNRGDQPVKLLALLTRPARR